MSPSKKIRATAPSRIDLAGGTLDIWPISLLVPDAVTVNLAIALQAQVTVASRKGSAAIFRSRDRNAKAERRLPLRPEDCKGSLSLLIRLVEAFSPGSGLSVETYAEAPAGAGLGGSSTLAVAMGAALASWTGTRLSREALLRRVMNVEASEIRVPTGNQDYLAAIHGGLAAYRQTVDGVRREPLPGAAALSRRLVLAYTGQPRQSGFSNWAMFRRKIEGDPRAVDGLNSIAKIANRMVDALRAKDLDRCGRLLGEEGDLRYGLAPAVSTPMLRRVGTAARRAGALGVKVCGAGGGGCLVAFAPEGGRDEIGEAMHRAGARLLPVQVAPRGVRVETIG